MWINLWHNVIEDTVTEKLRDATYYLETYHAEKHQL